VRDWQLNRVNFNSIISTLLWMLHFSTL